MQKGDLKEVLRLCSSQGVIVCAGVRPFDGIAALESLRLCKEA